MTSPPPLSNAQLEAIVAAASADDLLRALRIVLGAEQAYWERDFQRDQMWYSPAFFRILGLPPLHERDAINARIHPDDRADFAAAYGAAVRGGGTFSYDVRYLDHVGAWRWARAFGRVWLDERGASPLRLIGTLIDVHAERQARLDADEYARRYQRALNASAEAHFERTADQDDFFVSNNFAQLLGYPPGTPPPDARIFMDWVHPEDRPRLAAEISRAWAAHSTWESTYRLRQADGGWRWFRGRGRSEPDADGRVRMSGMVGDVHQQQLDREELDQHRHHLRAMVAERTEKLDAALAEARRQSEQAELASRAKSEFLAHMSHELRTPLNGLLGLTELALKVAEQPAQRRYLDVALNSGRALLQLIDEVLDFSRLDAGGLSLADEPFDLADTLAEVMRSLMPGVRAKGLSMRFDWVGEFTTVRGDAARVRQVVTNLAANAAKFTPQGQVALRAELVPEPHDGGPQRARATVWIDDTGPGIASAQQQSVFEPFVQADASLTRQHGGSGLGLSIARRLARAMGGDVTLEHSSPQGSRFAFRWPVLLDAQALPLPAIEPGRAWLVYQRREAALWLQHRLARWRWDSEIVLGVGAAAQRARGEAAPGLVVVHEQALDAQTDLHALRAALPDARLVLLVGPDWNQPRVEQQALAVRATVMMAPLTPRDLCMMLSQAVAVPVAAAVAPPRSGARVLVVEDNATNLLIAEAFLREIGHEPSGAVDGFAALAACTASPPQLVLMDLQMPGMDGFEATQRLRAWQAEGRLPRFPILALSAHTGTADREQAIAAGMDDYLTKPILFDALRAALARWLS